MVTKKEYNGWTNYETWLMELWISIDYDREVCDMAENFRHDKQIYEFGDALKEYFETLSDVSEVFEKPGFVSDFLNGAMSEIDWYDIAQHYHDDLDPEENNEED
jgi:hypothetical protein